MKRNKSTIPQAMAYTAILKLILNGGKQLIEINDGTREKFSWGEWFKKGGEGLLFGIQIGIFLDTLIPFEGDDTVFLETQYLREVLRSHDPKNDPSYNLQKVKTAEIADLITEEFNGMIYKPQISGSQGKGTSIAGSSDFDLMIPFQRYSFSSLEEMWEETYAFLQCLKKGDREIRSIRRQSKSIGLKCRIDGNEFWIDIVPGRAREGYPRHKDLSLHARSGNFWQTVTHIKTNIHEHKRNLPNNRSAIEVIKLLKIWKDREAIPISGFEIELMTARAFQWNSAQLPRTLYSKLYMTLEFFRDKIETIRLTDPAAPTKTLLTDPASRHTISKSANRILEKIDANSEYLKYYFPVRE